MIECQSGVVTHRGAGGKPFTECQGSTALIYEPATMSMEIGQSRVNVGTSLTGYALVATISSALQRMCPNPSTPGAMTSCETGEVTLGKATWLDKSEPQDGDLTVQVTNAQYNSTEYRDLFIKMLATSANASASGRNCKLLDWVKPNQNPPRKAMCRLRSNPARGKRKRYLLQYGPLL